MNPSLYMPEMPTANAGSIRAAQGEGERETGRKVRLHKWDQGRRLRWEAESAGDGFARSHGTPGEQNNENP